MKLAWPFASHDNPSMSGRVLDDRKMLPYSQPEPEAENAISLKSCAPFETVLVKTLQSTYEIVVISRHSGQVLVRGGRLFPEYKPAVLTGSTAGGSALKAGCIETGLRLELSVPGEIVRTSEIQSVIRGSSHS